eukprot:CAMPEP_0184696196 /NCGR_PEP_ID=MMETSP0313-20130426/3567_1 /TAXON_ID=2792 /ORGANISM="Porphyridium aerugineum, Strain SAG 1380-2" /LENGTH=186 /DNA_ID=CAMNT_0027154773 /DNA_START=41 /DNA_END=601 /DNA_ORIENTATION=-
MDNQSFPSFQSFHLNSWIAQNRDQLKPPVGNKLLYENEFKVMIVAGPNVRNDFHVEKGEEFFYQLQGEMVLRIVNEGRDTDGNLVPRFEDIHIREGETFCLPPNVPHSPQRMPNSIGLVVERRRNPGELDAMRWYCGRETTPTLLYEEQFFCHDLVTDLPPIIQRYRGNEEHRTCKSCGWVDTFDL